MKRALPFILVFVVLSLIGRFVMTGPRAQAVRAEIERRARRVAAECAEATETTASS